MLKTNSNETGRSSSKRKNDERRKRKIEGTMRRKSEINLEEKKRNRRKKKMLYGQNKEKNLSKSHYSACCINIDSLWYSLLTTEIYMYNGNNPRTNFRAMKFFEIISGGGV